MTSIFDALNFTRGPAMKNRMMLAPLTNQQSHDDGRLSSQEQNWLTMRARGGFGLVMTAAAHVQATGQGFPGQLGIFDDIHLDGLTRLATALREQGALSAVQLHHAGFRAPKDLVGTPVGPSDDQETGARALSRDEVEWLRDDFIRAALRAEKAGFDGVEVHGAHGYVISAFLSPQLNRRTDRYGGASENRARLLLEIIDGIRAGCRPDFQIGLRLSPERFGQKLNEIVAVSKQVMQSGKIDYLDLSLWDVRKQPNEDDGSGRTLLGHFTDLPRGSVRLGAAGKIMDGKDTAWALAAGCDFVSIGRAAILRHDFPARIAKDPAYRSPQLPISEATLVDEGMSPPFLHYMRGWPNFVSA